MFMMLLAVATQSLPTEIVVNGKRLDDANRTCIEGKCTTLRDAQVSIALAEQQFRNGNYVQAKKTLAAAVGRTKRNAATDPKPVAALYEAYATVSIHDGDQEAYKKAVIGRIETLRDNLPPSDPAVTDAALAIGDMWINLRNYTSAEQAYRTAEKRAIAARQPRVALLAGMRLVSLTSARGKQAETLRMLTELEARPAAQDPAMRTALRVLRFRMAARAADDSQMQKVVADMGGNTTARPVLLWQAPYAPTALAAAEDAPRPPDEMIGESATSTDFEPIRWVDVGFWIKPDGHTGTAEILRGSPGRQWADTILTQIAGRRYSVASNPASPDGFYKVERFTLRPTYRVPVGSLIRRRAGAARLEVLDLTAPSKNADRAG